MKRLVERSRIIAVLTVAVLLLPLAAPIVCRQVRAADMTGIAMGTDQELAHAEAVISDTSAPATCVTFVMCTTSVATFFAVPARLDVAAPVSDAVSRVPNSAALSVATEPTPPPPRA